ncbi:GSU2403 family nucleotidyltransferase fold protein [Roseibium salinum]|uniref:GSU2403 family nucleotidyltransferase fold protein n=1 Tax=Roseibium salinum TaxID=1604349 RepID=A0ABT3RA47_9HYPH|nr:GSU2403 family nucleotidyltransferase fold protein [Roseibium sp. DSM 29163]MCX2725813.1 GSU2403 family nucleotidyltransferase fold protein [Roseibium sp. DSM 29163]
MTVDYHSAIGTAAWTDLRRSLIESAVSDLRGTPRAKAVGTKTYWYDHFRLGNKTIDRYIGEDTPELRMQLDRQSEIARAAKQAQRDRARLMRVLRAEGYLFADVASGQVVSAMAKAGVFRLGGTIVGTQAFRCYEGELGVRIGFDQSAATDDIDIASFERLSLALADTVEPPLAEVFAELQFDPLPTIDHGKTWRWRQTNRQALVEFLTPSFEQDEAIRDLPALGVNAQSLHFLNYLIAEPIRVPFLYRSGVLVQIPRPERYAVHKLIVADRRQGGPDALKAHKDRAQAAFLIEALAETRPDDIAEAYQLAIETGPAWRQRIAASLLHMPATAELLKRLP